MSWVKKCQRQREGSKTGHAETETESLAEDEPSPSQHQRHKHNRRTLKQRTRAIQMVHSDHIAHVDLPVNKEKSRRGLGVLELADRLTAVQRQWKNDQDIDRIPALCSRSHIRRQHTVTSCVALVD